MTEDKRYSPEEALLAAKDEVDRTLRRAPVLIRGYTGHLAGSTGKFIRAASLLFCAMEAGNTIKGEAVGLAAAIELLHLATLVHDDIIDDADLRRGSPTLHRVFGKRPAVICGDYLLSAALKKAAAITEPERYRGYCIPNYVERICLGELRQQMNRNNYGLSVYRYLSIISGKTAALFEASFYGGAVFSEPEEKRLRGYRRMGYDIGMIFQLMDDCNDFQLDEQSAGKNVQSDYEQGVITLPLIHTFEKNRELMEKARMGLLCRKELNRAVEEAGGVAFTRFLARRYLNRAIRELKELGLAKEKEKRLLEVFNKAYYGPEKRKDERHECGDQAVS